MLAIDASQLAVREHRARVCEVALEERAADERGDPLGRGSDLVERGPGGLEEARPQEQVLGRVARDGELGEDDEVGAGGAGLADRVDDERAVTREVADDGIELGEREPHAWLPTMFSTARHKLHSTAMLAPLTIARRFRGPRTSANGGYARAARPGGVGWTPAGVEVTLRLPPPLERPLAVDAGRRARAAARRRGARRRGARRRSRGHAACAADVRGGGGGGPRAGGLGRPGVRRVLRLRHAARGRRPRDPRGARAGRDDGLVATTWVAQDVRPEIVWAAIDCPGAYALRGDGRGEPLLARMTARIDRLPAEGERCVVGGWPLDDDGRKRHAATALYGEDGAAVAVSRQLWIEPRRRRSPATG